MPTEDLVPCPWCAEPVRKDAVKCRYCGSMIGNRRPESREHWARVNAGKKIAGVCTGIAAELNAPQMLLPLRIFFAVSVFFGGFGIFLYLVLWILMPGPVDQPRRPESRQSARVSVPADKEAERPGRSLRVFFLGLFVVLLVLTGVLFVNFLRHAMYGLQNALDHPSLWHMQLNQFPQNFMPWSISTILFIIIALVLLYLLSTDLFRFGLGCVGVLIVVAILVALVPLLIAGLVLPAIILLPILFLAAVVTLIFMVIKALLD